MLSKVLLIVASLACVAHADVEFVSTVSDSDYRRYSRTANRAAADTENCTMIQYCKEHNPDGSCKDATKTYNPELVSWTPKPLPPSAMFKFFAICPFMPMQGPVCCNADQVDIMTTNFMKIDQVFGGDVPMCGVNQKKLWCEYTCSPRQKDFVNGTGYKMKKGDDGSQVNMTKVVFSVNEDMACTQFQSCKKVQLIASASIQSALSFLDFLGNNGEQTSLSIITFTFDPVNQTGPSPTQQKLPSSNKESGKCGSDNANKVTSTAEMVQAATATSESDPEPTPITPGHDDHVNHPWPLDVSSYPCDQKVPADGKIDGYKVKGSHCTFCDALCEPPAVNGDIGFFDGFDGKMVGIVYGAIIFVSIVIQVIRCFCCAAKINEKYEVLVGDDLHQNAQERASHLEKFNEQYK